MGPNLYEIFNANAAIKTTLGVDNSGDVRLYPFNRSEELSNFDVYAVYELSMEPQNILRGGSKIDLYSIQLSIYAKTQKKLVDAYNDIRDQIEKLGYITNVFNEYNASNETRTYSIVIFCDLFENR